MTTSFAKCHHGVVVRSASALTGFYDDPGWRVSVERSRRDQRIKGGNVSIVSELSVWQQLLLAGLAVLSFVYVFYFKIWVTLAAGSDLVFASALAVAITSIAAPGVFGRIATEFVDRSSLPEALISVDEKVAAIEALPGELIDRALAKLGRARDPEDASLNESEAGPGPFEARIRPSVEALVAGVLRVSSFLISTLLLLMALALRSSTSTARALHTLTQRTDDLERRLADDREDDRGNDSIDGLSRESPPV